MTMTSHAAGSRLKPYLTTAQLISLAALASPIISLLFILFRLSASSDSAQQSVSSAKDTLQASCLAAEHSASVGASLPRYLAQGVNEQITDGVRASIEGVRIGLTLSLTATEALIGFIIDMYRSTFLCLLELVVRGGLSVVISAVSNATSFVNQTLSSISSGIADDIASANNLIRAAVEAVESIPFVGDNIDIPLFSIPSASRISNIQIPTTFEDSLRNLNDTLPTLNELSDKFDSLISVPFQLVKKEINDTFLEAQASFVANPLPVPQQATVSFCGETLTSSFDDLARDLLRVAHIGIGVVIGTMALLFIGYAIVTWYSQRSLRNNVERIRLLWFGEGTATTDRLLAFDALISHPIWTTIVQFLTEKFHWSQEKYDAITWFGLYVFHPFPMACLLIGIFGILSVQLQLAIISPLQAHYSNEVASNINDLTGIIATKLNETMWQDSGAYAVSLNEKIISVETSINTDLFGWVNATIVPLNNTISSFYEEIQDTVSSFLGNTPLELPAQEFIRCLIGTKVEGIENALTFLHENLHVDLPRVDTNVLALSQDNINEVATPISVAAVGSGDSGDGGVIGKIISAYVSALEKERITFCLFLLLWVLAVVMALFIITYHFWFRPGLRRKGWEPRWMSGSSWEDKMVFKPNQDHEKYQNYNPGNVSPVPFPLRKNAIAKSTSATYALDPEEMRQRRHGDARDSDTNPSILSEEGQQPGFFVRLGSFMPKRSKHTPKDSGSSILPIAASAQLNPVSTSTEAEQDWFDRMAFWKRSGAATDGGVAPQSRLGLSGRRAEDELPTSRLAISQRGSGDKTKPTLRVDVAKASASSSRQPRIIVENPDFIPQSPRLTPSLKAIASSDRRERSYLAVPPRTQPRRVHEPKPPAWLIAMKNKQGLPAIPGESSGRSSPPSRPHDTPFSSSERGSNSNSLSWRPPGLLQSNEHAQPTVPKPAVTRDSRERHHQGERRQTRRRSSVPPGARHERTEPMQQRNKSLTRLSSLDDIDPFATPLSMGALPLPLDPVKLHSTPNLEPSTSNLGIIPRITITNPSGSNNPFTSPFDDFHAIRTTGTEPNYSFSMPSMKQGAI